MDIASKVKLASKGVAKRDINDYNYGEIEDAKTAVKDTIIKEGKYDYKLFRKDPETTKVIAEMLWKKLESNRKAGLAKIEADRKQALEEEEEAEKEREYRRFRTNLILKGTKMLNFNAYKLNSSEMEDILDKAVTAFPQEGAERKARYAKLVREAKIQKALDDLPNRERIKIQNMLRGIALSETDLDMLTKDLDESDRKPKKYED